MPAWQTTKGIFSAAADTKFGRVALDSLDAELRALPVSVALDGVTQPGSSDQFIVDYKAEPSAAEKQLIEAAVAAHEGIPQTAPQAKVNDVGALAVEVTPRTGSPFEDYAVNWCDPTTWWPDAEKVENVVANSTGDPLVFDLPDERIIDVTHGKITQEFRLADMAPVVSVGGIVLTERSFGYDDHAANPGWGPNPHDAGDYTIDYAAGTITFFDPPIEPPTVTYHRATSSNWYITPKDGKTIRVLAIEVQFSRDIEMRDAMVFVPEILAAAAAAGGMLDPAMLASNGGPIPDTSYLPIAGREREYKRIRDFIVEAQRSFPIIPQVGGSSYRAMGDEFVVFRWPYEEAAARDLSASQFTRLRVGLKNHIPFGGTFANATSYSVSESES